MSSDETKRPKKGKPGRPKGEVQYVEEKHCGARSKQHGRPCVQVKGFGTDHVGEGRCKHHGGAVPIIHGRYSRLRKSRMINRLNELMEAQQAEKNPLDLTDELNLVRARLQVHLEQESDDMAMLTTWHESYTGKFRGEMNELQRLLRSKNPANILSSLKRLREILDQMPPKPPRIHNPMEFIKAINAIANLVAAMIAHRERQQVPISSLVDMEDKMALVLHSEARRMFGVKKGNALALSVTKQWRNIQVEF